ncbi:M15 family peptidase [Geoalkalibacter halelectricus]|uniref:M15 family peptidase n=1 Tax=Geoalkalibacter halelectricus TaxID=2847045 RepID=A0ABY5ZT76_9BACT|nr:M15 family peptidase [Geoalkalibacter halelectricus]MDO3376933.1 M15 family peptidase [Geoalkalibacter halelectricus]UWZ81157.1 M15 family peptidase [Geoalkalibacter halelectricus]
MRAAAVRLMQQLLVDEGFAPGPIDGKLGPQTYVEVDKALARDPSGLPQDWQAWSSRRKAVAFVQLQCKARAIEVGKIDGFWGPQTDYAADTLAFMLENGEPPRLWRDEVPLDINPNHWPKQREADLMEFFGPTGGNQVRLSLPYPHRLAWDLRTSVNAISCNAKVHDSLARVLHKVRDHYGLDGIRELHLDRWGGCLNVRKMRGGSQWSMHSWGIALDYDPERNQLRWGRDRAVFARPEYDAWWRFWEEEGWTSLGRSKNYDWMHIQATKL